MSPFGLGIALQGAMSKPSSRREFLRSFGRHSRDIFGVGSVISLSPFEARGAYRRVENSRGETSDGAARRLSWKAYREAGHSELPRFECKTIEGNIPGDLCGSLYRIGPGTKNTFGTRLTHLFDGDAFATAFRFRGGKVFLEGRFVQTPERVQETRAGQMIFHDFGTSAPSWMKFPGFKSAPVINIRKIGSQLLAMSESEHPFLLESETLDTLGQFSFDGALPNDCSFSGHPRFDPHSGDWFFFGFTKALFPQLKVFRYEVDSKRVSLVSEVPLGGFYLIHDMIVTKNYLVFLVPSIRINPVKMVAPSAGISSCLEFETDRSMRAILVSKTRGLAPKIFTNLPSRACFHHVRANESSDGRTLRLLTIVYRDGSVFDTMATWGKADQHSIPLRDLAEIEFDLTGTKDFSRFSRFKIRQENVRVDFPSFDETQTNVRKVYFAGGPVAPGDSLISSTIECLDIDSDHWTSSKSIREQMVGEPIVASGRDRVWILNQGYDAQRDETFLDVRDPESLEIQARIWTGIYFPLGFHGSFSPE